MDAVTLDLTDPLVCDYCRTTRFPENTVQVLGANLCTWECYQETWQGWFWYVLSPCQIVGYCEDGPLTADDLEYIVAGPFSNWSAAYDWSKSYRQCAWCEKISLGEMLITYHRDYCDEACRQAWVDKWLAPVELVELPTGDLDWKAEFDNEHLPVLPDIIPADVPYNLPPEVFPF